MKLVLLLGILTAAPCAIEAVSQTTGGIYYVLDSETPASPDYHIYAVSPENRKVIRVYDVGRSADMALAPDGSRLYVSSIMPTGNNQGQHYLDVYDTSSGTVLNRTENPDGLGFTVPIHDSELAISPSGNWLYLIQMHVTPQGWDLYLTGYDTIHNSFLPSRVSLSGCEGPVMLPSAQDLTVDLACYDGKYLRITLGRVQGATQRRPIAIPSQTGDPPWRVAFLKPGGQVGVIKTNGNLLAIDTASGQVVQQGTTTPLAEDLRMQRALVSESLGSLYFASAGPRHGSFEFDRIVAVDLNTGSVKGTVTPDSPFFSLALSHDGKLLLTVSPEARNITVVDASTLKVQRILTGPWALPILALPAP
jgi:hypothetical protein